MRIILWELENKQLERTLKDQLADWDVTTLKDLSTLEQALEVNGICIIFFTLKGERELKEQINCDLTEVYPEIFRILLIDKEDIDLAQELQSSKYKVHGVFKDPFNSKIILNYIHGLQDLFIAHQNQENLLSEQKIDIKDTLKTYDQDLASYKDLTDKEHKDLNTKLSDKFAFAMGEENQGNETSAQEEGQEQDQHTQQTVTVTESIVSSENLEEQSNNQENELSFDSPFDPIEGSLSPGIIESNSEPQENQLSNLELDGQSKDTGEEQVMTSNNDNNDEDENATVLLNTNDLKKELGGETDQDQNAASEEDQATVMLDFTGTNQQVESGEISNDNSKTLSEQEASQEPSFSALELDSNEKHEEEEGHSGETITRTETRTESSSEAEEDNQDSPSIEFSLESNEDSANSNFQSSDTESNEIEIDVETNSTESSSQNGIELSLNDNSAPVFPEDTVEDTGLDLSENLDTPATEEVDATDSANLDFSNNSEEEDPNEALTVAVTTDLSGVDEAIENNTQAPPIPHSEEASISSSFENNNSIGTGVNQFHLGGQISTEATEGSPTSDPFDHQHRSHESIRDKESTPSFHLQDQQAQEAEQRAVHIINKELEDIKNDRDFLLSKLAKYEQIDLNNRNEYQELKDLLREKEIEVSILKKNRDENEVTHKKETSHLQDRISFLLEKNSLIEKDNKELERKLKEKFVNNHSKEKVLESQLEFLKLDSQKQLESRESKIIELKRKIDSLEFDLEGLREKDNKMREGQQLLEAKLGRVMKTLNMAVGLLDEDNISEQKRELLGKAKSNLL